MPKQSKTTVPYWLSIIIPFYNVEKYIAEMLDSVIAGVAGQVEIILIDDGSTDRSAHIVAEYTQLLDIVLITQPNSGQGEARNTGVRSARGEYVYFLDSDDRTIPGFCEKVRARLAADGWPDVLLFSASVFRDRGVAATAYDRAYERSVELSSRSQRDAMRMLMERDAFFASPCTYLFRCSLWRKHHLGFPNSRYEDEILFLQLVLCANTVSITKNEWFERRVRPESTMTGRVNQTHMHGRHHNLGQTLAILGPSLVDRTGYGKAVRKYLCTVTIVYVQSAKKVGAKLDWHLIREALVQMRSFYLRLRLISHMLPFQRFFGVFRQFARRARSWT